MLQHQGTDPNGFPGEVPHVSIRCFRTGEAQEDAGSGAPGQIS
jgi:hypothetical protein